MLKAPQVNWGKIIMLVAIVLVVVAGAIFLFWYMNNSAKADKPVPEAAPVTEEQSTQPAVDTTAATRPAPPAQNDAPVANADGTITYNVALHQYPTRERAESRVAKLKSYGNSSVSMVVRDSASYFVTISVSSLPADTTRVVDSLKKLFNPGGKVEILK